MAESAATNNVFLDTKVFDCHQFDFGALSFRRLVRLTADGPMRILLTNVTVSEIRKHIDEHAEKAFKQVETFRRILPLTRSVVTPDLHQALTELKDKLDAAAKDLYYRWSGSRHRRAR